MLRKIYQNLTPWETVQVARHPHRPLGRDYIDLIVKNFVELRGDRRFADDKAIFGGFGRIGTEKVMIIGQHKGRDTKEKIAHNFGMAQPEGYRKARRLMQLADRFHLPVVTFVDTTGAYPGIGAEERGQAEAIARSVELSLNLKVPIISVIIGEGGSGGAIAIATANRVYMLEHAIYSVISPEAGASILWRDASRAKDVAIAMKITAQDLLGFGIIDGIIGEPVGGGHRDREFAIAATGKQISDGLQGLSGLKIGRAHV